MDKKFTARTFGPLASGGLWFFAHTIPWMPAGPTSIDYKPTDNPKTLDKLRNDPVLKNVASVQSLGDLVIAGQIRNVGVLPYFGTGTLQKMSPPEGPNGRRPSSGRGGRRDRHFPG